MRRRKGETLVEFIMAMYIFAMVMTWVVGFITGQTQAFVNIKNRSDLMFRVRHLMNVSGDHIASGQHYPFTAEAISIDISDNGKTLTATKGTGSNAAQMTFTIKPSP